LNDVLLHVQIRGPTDFLGDPPITEFYTTLDSVVKDAFVSIPSEQLRAHHVDWRKFLLALQKHVAFQFDESRDLMGCIRDPGTSVAGARFIPIVEEVTFHNALSILQARSLRDTTDLQIHIFSPRPAVVSFDYLSGGVSSEDGNVSDVAPSSVGDEVSAVVPVLVRDWSEGRELALDEPSKSGVVLSPGFHTTEIVDTLQSLTPMDDGTIADSTPVATTAVAKDNLGSVDVAGYGMGIILPSRLSLEADRKGKGRALDVIDESDGDEDYEPGLSSKDEAESELRSSECGSDSDSLDYLDVRSQRSHLSISSSDGGSGNQDITFREAFGISETDVIDTAAASRLSEEDLGSPEQEEGEPIWAFEQRMREFEQMLAEHRSLQ
jgi:hypothetical protein